MDKWPPIKSSIVSIKISPLYEFLIGSHLFIGFYVRFKPLVGWEGRGIEE